MLLTRYSFPKQIGLLLLCFCGFTGFAQQTTLRGYLLGIEDNRSIPLASLLNQTDQKHFISSRQGFFAITVLPTDSIKITAIGYEPVSFIAKDLLPENNTDTIQLFMRPVSYLLNDVTILSGNHRRDSILRAAAEFLKNDPLLNNYERALGTHTPKTQKELTAMWNEYSKGGKDLKDFANFYYHAQMLKQVNTRYNKQSIKRYTDLDDKYLDDYIVYCQLNFTFILNSSDYDLIMAVRECANRFKAEKGID